MSEVVRATVPAQTLAEAVHAAMPMAQELLDALESHTGATKGITRTPYGDGEQYAHDLMADCADRLGLRHAVDPAGNLYLTLPGQDSHTPCWMVGSHLDSVPNGGNFDGAAGVIAGLAAIAALKSVGVVPRRDVTVMGIRAEEAGSWFSGVHGGHLGSRMALGLLEASELDTAIRTDTGQSLRRHLQACGCDPARIGEGQRHLDPARIHGYLELHIEQGPVLEQRAIPVGVVTGIRGNSRLRDPKCIGEYNHGGATPQAQRRDSVIATSELILAIDGKWHELETAGEDLIFTVGKLYTDPKLHSLSKVPGEVGFTLDIRSASPEVLATMRAFVIESASAIGARRGVKFDLGAFSLSEPTVLDASMRQTLCAGAAALSIPIAEIASGGGHDAQEFVRAGIPAAMIFVRNANGSHVAEEGMELDDFELGTRLLSWMVTG
ncbi:MAG: hydantoinase/carbamoylase family amidase [Proteobacteria bacterium]|nr:hydantoinase/carbamoylase family amidase [Burkholderiales bacterium]